jgi:hypothetical protein
MEFFGTMQERVAAVPESEYDAELTACSEQTSTHGPVNKFEFRLIGGSEIDGRKVTGLTPTTMAENTKKGRWIAALLGRVPAVGENITKGDVLNKRCRIVIVHKTDDKGQIFANVSDVLPAAPVSDDDIAF